MSGYEFWPDECEECAHEGGGCSHDLRLWFHGPMTLDEHKAMMRFRTKTSRLFKKVYKYRLDSLFPEHTVLFRALRK